MSRKTFFKLVCLVLPALLLAAAAESYYRWIRPKRDFYWTVAELKSNSPDKKLPVTFDPELGFRADFDGRKYSSYGTRVNSYPLARDGRYSKRVLFIGDSVTARGGLIKALEAEYRNPAIEYWNAGVEAFDPTQEWEYFERYNYRVEPDQIVLTFHNNDFSPQTAVDFDDDGHITFYSADPPLRIWMPWPLRDSAFVRAKLHRWYTKDRERKAPQRVEAALRSMRDRFATDGISFAVVLFPLMKHYRDWTPVEVESRTTALAIFKRLGLRTLDLLPALEQALDSGMEACETPGDTWHPSVEVCAPLARSLHEQRLLDVGDRNDHRTAEGAKPLVR
jgi:hypothetical protein